MTIRFTKRRRRRLRLQGRRSGSSKTRPFSLQSVAEKIDRGEGTLGRLVQDESLYRDAKETIQSAKQTMESAMRPQIGERDCIEG